MVGLCKAPSVVTSPTQSGRLGSCPQLSPLETSLSLLYETPCGLAGMSPLQF